MSSWILRTLVPDSRRCVAKQYRRECGVIGFLMPDTRSLLAGLFHCAFADRPVWNIAREQSLLAIGWVCESQNDRMRTR